MEKSGERFYLQTYSKTMERISYDLNKLTGRERHSLLLSVVGPRPIAWASTVDTQGRVNLSPFSFFNAFSTSPPIVIFSSGRRAREAGIKNTHENVLEVPEVAISVVSHEVVQQMSLTSNEYDRGINEFEKAGLTMMKSKRITPPGVAESPVVMECAVTQVIPLGREGGAGNLIIAEVLLMHVDQRVLAGKSSVDTTKLDLIGRMGGNWYARAFGDALFEIPKPGSELSIGLDSLPKAIRESQILSGNDLGKLGSLKSLPSQEEKSAIRQREGVKEVLQAVKLTDAERACQVEKLAKEWISKKREQEALALLMSFHG